MRIEDDAMRALYDRGPQRCSGGRREYASELI
jgi:hypothetical protein